MALITQCENPTPTTGFTGPSTLLTDEKACTFGLINHPIKEVVGAINVDSQPTELFLDLTDFRRKTLFVAEVSNPIVLGCPMDEGVTKALEEVRWRKAPVFPQELHNPLCPPTIVPSPIVGKVVARIYIVYDGLD